MGLVSILHPFEKSLVSARLSNTGILRLSFIPVSSVRRGLADIFAFGISFAPCSPLGRVEKRRVLGTGQKVNHLSKGHNSDSSLRSVFGLRGAKRLTFFFTLTQCNPTDFAANRLGQIRNKFNFPWISIRCSHLFYMFLKLLHKSF